MGKQNAAVITATLAAGSTTSPYFFEVNISQRLCHKSCVESMPSFAPIFTMKSVSQVGTGQFVATIHIEGVIAYTPCDGNVCCTKTQLISQDFTIPFASATAPTSVTVTVGSPVNAIVGSMCQKCSRHFVNETPLTLTVA